MRTFEFREEQYSIDGGWSQSGQVYRLHGREVRVEIPEDDVTHDLSVSRGPDEAVITFGAGEVVAWPVLYWFLGEVLHVGDLTGLRGTSDQQTSLRIGSVVVDVPGVSATRDRVAFVALEYCSIPWPEFRRFLESVERSGAVLR